MEPECQKKCKRDCHQTRYRISMSNAKKTLALTNKHKSIISRDLITVSFNWGSFEYVGLEQGWKYSPVEFISALGGAIGVYLGLSVLTLIVGLVYGCDMAFHYLRNNNKSIPNASAVNETKQGIDQPASNGKTPADEEAEDNRK